MGLLASTLVGTCGRFHVGCHNRSPLVHVVVFPFNLERVVKIAMDIASTHAFGELWRKKRANDLNTVNRGVQGESNSIAENGGMRNVYTIYVCSVASLGEPSLVEESKADVHATLGATLHRGGRECRGRVREDGGCAQLWQTRHLLVIATRVDHTSNPVGVAFADPGMGAS